MKHVFRFFAQLKNTEPPYEWLIEGDENHHLTKVLRMAPGDLLEVFDGKGNSAQAKLESSNKNTSMAHSDKITTSSEKKTRTGMALAFLKKNTLEDLIPSLVELDLDEIHLFAQQQTPKHLYTPKQKERFEKIILGASKQAKRDFLPKLIFWKETKSLALYLQENFQRKFLLNKGAPSLPLKSEIFTHSCCAIIGSEAGFSEEEMRAFFEVNAESFSLGANTLRAFTAAISAGTFLQHFASQHEKS